MMALQRAWLKVRYPAFCNAQNVNNTNTFFTSTIQVYFDEFHPGIVIASEDLDETQYTKQAVEAVAAVKAVGEDGQTLDLLTHAKVS